MTSSRSAKIDPHVCPTGPSGDKALVLTEGVREYVEEIKKVLGCK